MIIRSLENPVYTRKRRGGLAGQGYQLTTKIESKSFGKSFEDYLFEAFQGELVQKGNWVSSSLSELTKKNIKRI